MWKRHLDQIVSEVKLKELVVPNGTIAGNTIEGNDKVDFSKGRLSVGISSKPKRIIKNQRN